MNNIKGVVGRRKSKHIMVIKSETKSLLVKLLNTSPKNSF